MIIDSVLTSSDIHSPVWKKIEVWAESRLVAYHKKLEIKADMEETSSLRGSIKELRSLLQLGKPVVPPHVSDTANDSIPSVIF
jgi:hypothetical protein